MQCARDRQGESGNERGKAFPFIRKDRVFAAHYRNRSFNHGATGIAKNLAWLQMWLFANHPLAADFLYLAIGIGDQPVSAQQLARNDATVGNGDCVGKDIAVFFW